MGTDRLDGSTPNIHPPTPGPSPESGAPAKKKMSPAERKRQRMIEQKALKELAQQGSSPMDSTPPDELTQRTISHITAPEAHNSETTAKVDQAAIIKSSSDDDIPNEYGLTPILSKSINKPELRASDRMLVMPNTRELLHKVRSNLAHFQAMDASFMSNGEASFKTLGSLKTIDAEELNQASSPFLVDTNENKVYAPQAIVNELASRRSSLVQQSDTDHSTLDQLTNLLSQPSLTFVAIDSDDWSNFLADITIILEQRSIEKAEAQRKPSQKVATGRKTIRSDPDAQEPRRPSDQKGPTKAKSSTRVSDAEKKKALESHLTQTRIEKEREQQKTEAHKDETILIERTEIKQRPERLGEA